MILLFVILIMLVSVILGFFILVQNPKGGGLAGNIAGFSTQFMGVKQTTDVLEKGTWTLIGIIAVLSIASSVFLSKTVTSGEDKIEKIGTAVPIQPTPTPGTTIPLPGTITPAQNDPPK